MFTTLRRFSVHSKHPKFGLLIDIDGVILQGNVVIPKVLETFKKLTSSTGKFVLPTVFVTNSGNQLTKEKAAQLSKWLGIEVGEDHLVCSHDPFKCYKEFHEKNVLITGQGRVKEVARSIGFKKTLTIEDLVKVFPMLDAVDVSRRVNRTIPDVEFSPVEAIVMLGEPIRWESSLQLLLDVLLTNGDPRRHDVDFTPHLPVLACNMDLQWRFTAEIPRFGHGVFLHCLENVFEKITGDELQYRVLVGKPGVVTYKYALRLVEKQAEELGIGIENLYMIGDNVNTDILGGNLFNRHLKEKVTFDSCIDVESSVRNCYSVLVKTGVSSEDLDNCQRNHVHREFLGCDKNLWKPTYAVQDFSDAINLIFRVENFC
ncbi:haloacid dehalogenase-like hydrolase domain-containing 5 [Macrosteles quadrilineatus]|uniref:haloacid dehalogenase-like hydrolase domain-containing 5 n=1 Tax=Macrosteles quadrilineatus TaxID=74068 RepID=UPI0023E28806|nr:haloacid dehalogenase-like hydrolase domain-containing 5 [Macrosteles quadrilineatus]